MRDQNRVTKRACILLIILFASLSIPTSVSYACTLPPMTPDQRTFEERLGAYIEYVEYIFVGTSVYVPEYPNFSASLAMIEVTQYLKGSGPTYVMVGDFNDPNGCDRSLGIGRTLIFFATGDPEERLQVSHAGIYWAYTEVDDETLNLISEHVDQPAVTPYPSTPMIDFTTTITVTPQGESGSIEAASSTPPAATAIESASSPSTTLLAIGALAITVGLVAAVLVSLRLRRRG
jgi:hypothetical protein